MLTHPDGDVIGDKLSAQYSGAGADGMTEHAANEHTEHVVTEIIMNFSSWFRLFLREFEYYP